MKLHNHHPKIERGGETMNQAVLILIIIAVFGAIFKNGNDGRDDKEEPRPAIVYGSMVDEYMPALIKTESGGNHKAVSRKGARGITQIMPESGKRPGYGVKPLQNHSKGEYIRFTREYLEALSNKYDGNMVLALAAYNAGAGTVDRALQKAGGDVDKAIALLPEETQNYVVKVAGYEQQVASAFDALNLP